MSEKVVFIDDEKNILSGFRRTLGIKFDVFTTDSVKEGLEYVKNNQPAVVVSDYKMPEMNGVDVLKECFKISNNSTRILLTGYADIDIAMSAINEGYIFRFLTKPCEPQILQKALNDGIRNHQLQIAEKELIKGTVQGSIKMITDILSLTNPLAFGQGERISKLVSDFLQEYKIANSWHIEVASMLCNIGFVALPPELVEKACKFEEMTISESEMYLSHTKTASSLLIHIPRFKEIAQIIEKLEYTSENRSKMPIGTRLIRIARDFDLYSSGGIEITSAIKKMKDIPDLYDEIFINVLEKVVAGKKGYVARDLEFKDVKEGMIIREDVRTKDKVLLLKKGQVLNATCMTRLNNYHKSVGLKEPLCVIVQVS